MDQRLAVSIADLTRALHPFGEGFVLAPNVLQIDTDFDSHIVAFISVPAPERLSRSWRLQNCVPHRFRLPSTGVPSRHDPARITSRDFSDLRKDGQRRAP